VGLYHAPGDVTDCDLIRVDLATGANATLFSKISACAALTTNFPSFSAAGAPGRLLVAIGSAPSVFAIDMSTGAAAPLGSLANNDSDILTGLAHWAARGVTLVTTQFGVWNATDPGQNELLLPLSGADAFAGAFAFAGPWPTLYIADEASASIVLVDVEAGKVAKRATGLSSPIGTVLNGKELLQERGYVRGVARRRARDLPHPFGPQRHPSTTPLLSHQVLYSTPAAGGAAKRVLSIPDGPGYPRTNGMAGPNFWWFFDFANLQVADLKAKTVAIVGDGFIAAFRGMGFPIYVPA